MGELQLARKLRNIRIEEVSLVDRPANRRPFMFVKADSGLPEPEAVEKQFKQLKLEVDSDGTTAGTAVKLNGKDLADMKNLVLSMSPVGDSMNIYAEYSCSVEGEKAGFSEVRTYRLTKSDPEPQPVQLAKAVDADVANVTQYLDDLPPGVRDSVRNIMQAVAGQPGDATSKETTTMPEPTKQDGSQGDKPKTDAQPVAAPQPVVDVNAIAAAVAAQLAQQGVTAEGIKAAVLGQIAADRKVADDKAAQEAAAHRAAVEAGEELEFTDEADLLASIAAEANREAIGEVVQAH